MRACMNAWKLWISDCLNVSKFWFDWFFSFFLFIAFAFPINQMLSQQLLNLLSHKNFLLFWSGFFPTTFGKSWAWQVKLRFHWLHHSSRLLHMHLNWWLNKKNGNQGFMIHWGESKWQYLRLQTTVPQFFSFGVWEVGFKGVVYFVGLDEEKWV